MRSVLQIEYEYVRIYMHSLPLQAFVNRCVANTPSKHNVELNGASSRDSSRNDSVSSNSAGGGVSPEIVRKWMEEDAPYVRQLVDACQSVLTIIAQGVLSGERLKHLPVRTYFRIMTAAVFLLKVRQLFLYFLSIFLHFSILVCTYGRRPPWSSDAKHEPSSRSNGSLEQQLSELDAAYDWRTLPRLSKLPTPSNDIGQCRGV